MHLFGHTFDHDYYFELPCEGERDTGADIVMESITLKTPQWALSGFFDNLPGFHVFKIDHYQFVDCRIVQLCRVVRSPAVHFLANSGGRFDWLYR